MQKYIILVLDLTKLEMNFDEQSHTLTKKS